MSASNSTENLLLSYLLTTAAVTRPTAWFVALFNVDPGEAGSSGTDVTTTIRTAGRVAVPFAAPANGSIANSAVVDFGAAAGGATVTHFGIYDAATGGNLLVSGPLAGQPITVNATQNVSFAAGALTVSLD